MSFGVALLDRLSLAASKLVQAAAKQEQKAYPISSRAPCFTASCSWIFV